MKRLNDTLFLEALKSHVSGSRLGYKAYYSSFLGGVTTEPHHMVVPIDDHMVHRGDAVFEAVKFEDGFVYALERHLERLEASAANISLKLPGTREERTQMILETIKVSGLRSGIVRLFLARGPGGFTTNPYETIGTQTYCAITASSAPSAELYNKGVRTGLSKISVKEGFFARTKTCNYLPNVLMKKEALDRRIDYVISQDEAGNLAEGSTENFTILDKHGVLVVPKFDRILRGVTAVRAMELAETIGIKAVNRSISLQDVREAQGAMMMGTTIDILPVASFEETNFKMMPEPMRHLMSAFIMDLETGPLRTEF
jgi:branched-chain amino acid aminotransferase